MAERVKTAKRRSASSTRWLERQLNDPYVQEAQRRGYRSRAAFKLIELDDKFHFLKGAKRIVDLGAAPGGWTQIALERAPGATVAGIDLLPIDPLPQATFLEMDFLDDSAPDRLKEILGGEADVVLSDMSPNTTGHASTDHLRIMNLVETALMFAEEVLAPGGTFVAKVFRGGTEQTLLNQMKRRFETVKHAKPPASRKGSAESYVIAQEFRPASEE
ncbi:MAG: RlmE family RNA methyltransferase [Alphaproteobacteria bacterium]|nr:RlmE family RNA methyltransferase [Alphaproteobacteria bacterium]